MAKVDSGAKPLQNAMKMAKAAIQLDGGNRHKEAYCEYLRTINYISHALLEEAVSQMEKEIVSVEVARMLTLAEQCLERAKSFVGKSTEPPDLSASAFSSGSPGLPEPHQTAVVPASHTADTVTVPAGGAPVATDHKSSSPRVSGRSRPLSDEAEEPSPFLPPEVFHKLQAEASQDTSKKELTPIEEASRLNQKLKANYEARLARLAPGQAYQKTSLTLSLQRQMMENLIIAKARQDALQRKMEDRRLRLQEEANRYSELFINTDHDWPKQWKAKMKKNPDVSLVSNLVSYLLSQSDHTETPKRPARTACSTQSVKSFSTDSLISPSRSHNLIPKYEEEEAEEPSEQESMDRENSFEDLEQFVTQMDWVQPPSSTDDPASDSDLVCDCSAPLEQDESHVQELEKRALKEHLKAVVKDVHIAIDQLLSLCLLSFESLNTASFKDLCLASIEEAFFTPLWSALVALFRKAYVEREEAYETSVKLYADASPGDIGIPLKLFPQNTGSPQGSYPYGSAIQELKLLIHDRCPQRKLECIVRTLRLICACAEDYRCLHEGDTTPKTAAIGADDLLPILSYVALQCQCPQLVSECAALEEFIHEGLKFCSFLMMIGAEHAHVTRSSQVLFGLSHTSLAE
ncbi:VPS9 domain-containing protein 1 [Neolamprologus brichardi]|uniref:VPS9 domain-containing protein 1 n=1 Tax=Neolamprologus brichardi TaxID=32507 RepID=UPI0003EBC81B|nr:VPS9 domain-containing protein 1 [Neolamprologus brichardi]